jgi:hypothetical protein
LVLKINSNEEKSCAGAWGGVIAIFSFFPFSHISFVFNICLPSMLIIFPIFILKYEGQIQIISLISSSVIVKFNLKKN